MSSIWTLSFKNTVLGGLLNELKDRINSVRYRVDNAWYSGTINSKVISGADLIVRVDLPSQPTPNLINRLRILDSNNVLLSDTAVSIYRQANEALLVTFKSTVESDEEGLDLSQTKGYILVEDAISQDIILTANPNFEYQYSAGITSLELDFAPPADGISSEYVIQFRTGSGSPWAANTAYYLGQCIVAGGSRLYYCTSSGTSGNSAPTGTGDSITDGTLTWAYIGTIPVINIAGNITWNPSSPTFTTGRTYRLAFIPLGANSYSGSWIAY